MMLKLIIFLNVLVVFSSISYCADKKKDKELLAPFMEELYSEVPDSTKQAILKRSSGDLDELHMSFGLWLRNEKLRKSSWNNINKYYQDKGFKHLDDVSGEVTLEFWNFLINALPHDKKIDLENKQKVRHNLLIKYRRISDQCTEKILKEKKSISKCMAGNNLDLELKITKNGKFQLSNTKEPNVNSCIGKVFSKISVIKTENEDIDVILFDNEQCRVKKYFDMLTE